MKMGDDDPTDVSQWTDDGDSFHNSTTVLATSTQPGTLTPTIEPLIDSSSKDELIRYVQFTSLTIIAAIGFVSNVLVLLLFYKRPTLRTFSNRFVLNLSISHFWQSILILPTTVISIAADRWVMDEITCFISGFLCTTLNITSVLSLLLIALDRNCAVNSPLHYSMTITKKRTGCLIFLTWFIGVLSGSPPFLGIGRIKYRPQWHMCALDWTQNDPYSQAYACVLIVLGFMVPFLTTICVYASMFQAARNNSERARKHSVNSTSVETSLPDSQVKSGSVPPKKKCRRWSSGSNQFFGEEWKAVRTGMLVVTTFTLCWLPYFSVIFMETFLNATSTMPVYIMFMVVFCFSSACVINPYLYVFRNKNSRKHVKQILCPSNLNKNKKWIFHQASKDKENQAAVNPCILTASLENEGSEKVKALPALYQDIDGNWQVFSTSEEHSREELDETVSNISDDDFFDSGVGKGHVTPVRRKQTKMGTNVHSIYNNTYNNRNFVLKGISHLTQANSSNRLMLFRLKTSLNRDSTSSDTTENCSMSLESNNSNEHQGESSDISLPSRRGIGKYLFNTSEELWESRPAVTYHKRISSVAEDSTSSSEGKKNLSSFGSARRKSFIHSHMKNKKSSETTLSSNTSDTLESSSTSTAKSSTNGSRPKLVRQVKTIQPPEDYGGT
ncbi:melanopsin [Trichonephila clavata]|uniref:Melanopsin n=1 Tax=Trichonephila clavata TaxID=2740835 RepID=A0A8X6LZ43_TRICU|nr:melanopsin [Trichonephila clavata]